MEINGLPAHVLVVHGVVVLGPLAGLAGLLYAAVPRARDWLRWPLVALAAVTLVLVWVAVWSGEVFYDSARFDGVAGPLEEQIELHEERGEMLRTIATGFAVVAFVSAWWHGRPGPVRLVLHLALVALAVLTVVWTFLTGEAGARAVWGA